MKNSSKSTGNSVSKNVFLTAIFFLPMLATGQTTQSFEPPEGGDPACGNAIEIQEEPMEITFPEGEETVWLTFGNTYPKTLFELSEAEVGGFPEFSHATLYEGNSCGELVEVFSSPIAADSNLVYFNTSTPSEKYYLKLNRQETEEGFPLASFNIQRFNFFYVCPINPFDVCNLLKNGDFSNINNTVYKYYENSFGKGFVCHWESGFYTPDIHNYTTTKEATMWAQPTQWEGIKQEFAFDANKKYIISLKLTNSPNWPLSDSFHIDLHNPGYQVAYTILKNQMEKDVMSTVNFVFEPNNSYNEIYFYPKNAATNWTQSFMLLDDIRMMEFKADAGLDKSLTCGERVTVGPECPIPGARYNWSPSTGLNASNIPNPIASPSQTTTYTLTVSFNQNGTVHSTTDQVTVNVASQASAADVVVADGDDIVLTRASYPVKINYDNNTNKYSSNNQNFYIQGDFIVNADFEMTNCNIMLAQDARIIVKNGADFVFNGNPVAQDNFISSCGNNWDQIKVIEGASVSIDHAHPFKNSNNGVVSLDASDISITNTEFEFNERCLHIDGAIGNPLNLIFEGNTIDYFSPKIVNGDHYYPEHAIFVEDYGASFLRIGDNLTSAATRNTFYGRGGNIYISESKVGVYNNLFNGFNNPFFPFGNTVNKPTVAVRAVGSASIGSYTPFVGIYNNYFISCKGAINLTDNISTQVWNNSVNFDLQSNVVEPNLDNSYFIRQTGGNNTSTSSWIRLNTIYNIENGIVILDKTDALTKIEQNNLFLDPDVMSTAVKLSDISCSGVHVTTNKIKDAKFGLLLSDVVSTNNPIEITGNEITEIEADNTWCEDAGTICVFPSKAISVSNCDFVSFSENLIAYDPGDYSTSNGSIRTLNAGAYFYNNTFNDFRCNTVKNAGIAFQFSGTNTINNNGYITNNRYVDNLHTLYLTNNGIIGPQGDASHGFTNEWVFSSGTNPISHVAVSGSDGSLSPMNFHSSTTLYMPNPFLNVTYSGTVVPYTVGKPIYNDPLCSAPQNIAPLNTNGGLVYSTNLSIGVNDSVADFWKSPLFQNKAKFVAHADSFAHFELQRFYLAYKTDSAMQADAALSAVYDSLEVTPLGKSIDGKNAFSLANAHPFDLEYKSINSIYSAYMQNDSLSSIDSNIARNLAASCPYYKGMAVYKARNLMALLGEYHFINGCEMVKVPSGTSLQRLKSGSDGQSEFKLYPNPSTGLFRIQLPSGMEKADIKVYNIQGVLVKEQKLENQNTLDLSQMNNGIYLYKLIPSKGEIQTGKLQILK